MIKNKIKPKCCRIEFNKFFFVSLLYFALLTLFIILGKRNFWPDEGIYVALGKYIFSNGTYGLFEPFRPFLLPIILGILWKLGLNPLVFGYAFEFLMALTCIIVTWKITEKFFGKKYALISCIFILTNIQFIINSTRILADVPALAFAIISVYFFMNKKYFLSGVFSGISFMTRFTYGVLPVIIIVIYLFESIYYNKPKRFKTKIRNRKDLFKKGLFETIELFIGFIIVTLPYFIYSKIFYGSFTWTLKSADALVKGYAWFAEYSGFFIYLKKMFVGMPLILLSILGIFYFFMFVLLDRKKLKVLEFRLLLLSTFCFLFYIIYFGIFVRQEFRYALHMIFFASILISFGINCLDKIFKNNLLSAALTIIVMLLLLVQIVNQLNYVIDIYKGEYYSKSENELIDFLRKNIKKGDFLLTTTTTPAIYFDNKMLGFASYDYALGVLKENKWRKGLIIVNTCAYGCASDDYDCQEKRIEFLKELEKERLIFETEINNECSYKVYENR